ncbi:hypothetical protein AWB79_02573 [Caballeronia hypogeia]|uniref:N-acyl amino acid synthase FeeM catalytic core domain-containing protein n=1 Tax=Caballeronia hypogeia TaxID=1777140 RepID=A0A158ALK2_9BURK|nr:hypothetical protein [Caballeronia hypogeia]SAK58768.1 hypothetical protein AWB79_02573 [Caballeronia hypogeia]
MERLNLANNTAANQSESSTVRPTLTVVPALQKTERMPFTIRIVRDDAGLQKAVSIRRSAYGRHLPEFAETMTVEASDRDRGTAVLLAESKLDGAPLGTMRIQTNAYAPLAVEQSVHLPEHLAANRLAEATRLGVAGGMVGRVVKVALCKALWAFCELHGIDYMVITARSPLDREYEAMLFKDVFGVNEFLPMSHVGGLPHRVLAKDVAAARQRWEEARHPLFNYMVNTHHPDIDLQSVDLSFDWEPVRCPEAPLMAYGR